MSYKKDEGLEPSVSKAINKFLFGEGLEADFDARTILNKESFRFLLFHRLLDKFYNSKSAKIVADTAGKMFISVAGKGREQGVIVLAGHKPPREVPYIRGVEAIEEE